MATQAADVAKHNARASASGQSIPTREVVVKVDKKIGRKDHWVWMDAKGRTCSEERTKWKLGTIGKEKVWTYKGRSHMYYTRQKLSNLYILRYSMAHRQKQSRDSMDYDALISAIRLVRQCFGFILPLFDTLIGIGL